MIEDFYVFGFIVLFFLSLFWNAFAVIGIVTTIKWLLRKFRSNDAVIPIVPDNLVSYSNEPQPVQEYKTNVIENNINTQENDTKVTKPNVNVLLYLGSLLIIFSLFVFVAFTWSNYTPLSKLVIISLSTVAFYVAGVFFWNTKKYKEAGITFIVIGSASLALSGFGFWNFFFKIQTALTFSEYWILHSIVMIIAYYLIFKFIKIKKFVYVVLFAVYSFMVSVSFAYFNDVYAIFAILSLLNLFLYVYVSTLKNRDNRILLMSTILVVHYVISFILYISINLSSPKLLDASKVFSSAILVFSTLAVAIQSYLSNEKFARMLLYLEGIIFLPKLLLLLSLLTTDKTISLMVILVIYVFGYILMINDRLYRNISYFRNSLVSPYTLLTVVSGGFAIVQSIYIFHFSNSVQTSQIPLLTTLSILIISIVYYSYQEKLTNLRYLSLPFEITFLWLLVRYLFVNSNSSFNYDILTVLIFGLGTILVFSESIIAYYKNKKIPPSFVSIFLYIIVGTLMVATSRLYVFSFSFLALIYIIYYSVITKNKYLAVSVVFISYYSTLMLYFLLTYLGVPLKGSVSLMSLIFAVLGSSLLFVSDQVKVYIENRKMMQKSIFVIFYLSIFWLLMYNFTRIPYIETLELLVSWLLLSFGLYRFGGKNIKLSAGLPLLLFVWHIIAQTNITYGKLLIYTIPMSFYFYVLSVFERKYKDYKSSTSWQLLSYTSIGGALLVESMYRTNYLSVGYGLLLIVISSIIIFYNISRRNSPLLYLSFSFIIFELFVMFIDIITTIPWWIYLGLIGLSIIALAIWKTSKTKD